MAKTDPILYKYRSFDKEHYLTLLSSNTIFFSSPLFFNDPFDCHIPLVVGDETEEEIRTHLRQTLRDDPDSGQKLQKVGQSEDEWIESWVERIRKEPDAQRRRTAEITRDYAAKWGVFSLASSAPDKPGWSNLLMWSHYANSHTGYCVGLNTRKLLDCLGRNSEVGHRLFPIDVEYRPTYPIISLINATKEVVQVFSVKSDDWGYEKEVRILLDGGAIDASGKKIPGTGVQCNDDIIEDITIGVNMSNKNYEMLLDVMRKRSVKPKIYQAVIKEGEFRLDRTEISY